MLFFRKFFRTMSEITYPFGKTVPTRDAAIIVPDVAWLRMPLPYVLNHVNIWLIKDSDGWCAVDTGATCAVGIQVWENSLRTYRLVKQVVTHAHPDHAGMAGWLEKKTGASLWMTHGGYLSALARLNQWGNYSVGAMVHLFRMHGLDEERLDMLASYEGVYRRDCPFLPATFHGLRDGSDMVIGDDTDYDDWDLEELNSLLLPIIPLAPVKRGRISKPKKNALKQQLKEEAVKLYEAKEAEFPEPEALRELERVILLKVIDRKWMDHIDDMDQLRQGIGLQAYGQKDPLVEYKMSGFDMFDDMIANIQEDTVRLLFHVRIEQKVEREQVAKVTGTNKDDSVAATPKRRETAKVYPNDPCPCGSGKKYKYCCGRNA